MRIITHTCPDCGTILAGNVLEDRRRMKCPREGCETVLRFGDLDSEKQEHLVENREKYRIG
ncbi:hypothetical protein [Halorhabdus salina]|uniref:hypothetical protein n=1 Tax=Halorhabdus salina TaxID=2750670 RepID=UPI0015EFBBD0|nr:hypothetical protein [Halorhabdus salina]